MMKLNLLVCDRLLEISDGVMRGRDTVVPSDLIFLVGSLSTQLRNAMAERNWLRNQLVTIRDRCPVDEPIWETVEAVFDIAEAALSKAEAPR